MKRTAMMATAVAIAFVWLGSIVVLGYFAAQLVVLALEMLTKVTEELR